MRNLLKLFSILFIATFLLASPPEVHAQSWGEAGTASGNMQRGPMSDWMDTSYDGQTANRLICAVIGDLGGTQLFGCPEGSADTPLGKVLKGFCLAVSSVAVLFMIWEVFSGMTASANEGEFLGKRTHTTWAITRTVVGGLSLIPAFGGYCLAQLVMLWATAVGIGIAGGVLGTISTVPTAIYSAPPGIIKGKEVANRISSGLHCVSDWNAYRDKIKNDEVDDPSTGMQWAWQAKQEGNALEIWFGDISGADPQYHPKSCGTARFEYAEGITGDVGADGIGRSLAITMAREIQVLTQSMANAIDGAVRFNGSDDVKNMEIAIALALFDSNMEIAAEDAADAATRIVAKTEVKHRDWIAYGYQDVNKLVLNIKTARAANVKSSSTSPVLGPPESRLSASDKRSFVALREAASANKANRDLNFGMSPEERSTPEGKAEWRRRAMAEADRLRAEGDKSVETMKNAASATGEAVAGIFQDKDGGVTFNPLTLLTNAAGLGQDIVEKVLDAILGEPVQKLGMSVSSKLKSAAESHGGSPLRFLIDLGSEMAGWGLAIVIAFALASIPFAYVASGTVVFLGGIIMAVVLPITFFGLKLAAYLPFLTAIIWTGAILNWLVIVVESMFAAPLWAMVHLDLDGDSYNTQKTGHGYVFLLNLLFRPVIMVGCLFFAQAAINACFGLFLGHVAGTISNLSGQNSWWSNLLLIIGAVWVTIIFAEQIITQGMSAVFQIPDKVFTWIGGHFGSNVGVGLGDSTSGAIASSAGKVESAGGGAAKAGMARGQDKAGETQKHQLAEWHKNKSGKSDEGSITPTKI